MTLVRRLVRLLVVFVFVFVVSTPAARAADVQIPSVDRSVEMHGFVSPGFIVSTGNNYLARSKRGSFEFTEVGLNFTVPITDRLRTGIQLFARDLGPQGNYSPKVDWFYFDYRFEDWFGIRAGRVKIPFGLYNDSSDVDAARVPILLPQSIYPLNNRDALLAQTGGEVYGRLRMRGLGALEYRLYGGTIFIDPATHAAGQDIQFDVPFVVGERLLWETPLEGLRVGGTLQALRIDSVLTTPNGPLSLGLPVVLWVGSAEYAFDKLLVSAEYGRWIGRLESEAPFLRARGINERAYLMTSYRVTPWFQPGAYYSLFFENVDMRKGREASLHDVAGTLRFDVNHNWIVKLEGHFMSGTAGLDVALNDGAPLSQLQKNWAVFLAKSTVHF